MNLSSDGSGSQGKRREDGGQVIDVPRENVVCEVCHGAKDKEKEQEIGLEISSISLPSDKILCTTTHPSGLLDLPTFVIACT